MKTAHFCSMCEDDRVRPQPTRDPAGRLYPSRNADTTRERPARLFVALWPEPALRDRLALERDRWQWPTNGTAAVVATDRLHVTLHFIGDVARDRIAELAAALDRPVDPFTLVFGRHALWSNGIAALEPSSTPAGLHVLHRALGDAIESLGLPRELRRFRPHVTFARRAGGSSAPADPIPFEWPVRDFALVESKPGGRGYTVLQTIVCR